MRKHQTHSCVLGVGGGGDQQAYGLGQWVLEVVWEIEGAWGVKHLGGLKFGSPQSWGLEVWKFPACGEFLGSGACQESDGPGVWGTWGVGLPAVAPTGHSQAAGRATALGCTGPHSG